MTNQPNALFRAADNGESITSMRGGICVIRVDHGGAFEVRECQVVLAAEEIGLAEKLVTSTLARIQPNGRPRAVQGPLLDPIWCIVEAMLEQQRQG